MKRIITVIITIMLLSLIMTSCGSAKPETKNSREAVQKTSQGETKNSGKNESKSSEQNQSESTGQAESESTEKNVSESTKRDETTEAKDPNESTGTSSLEPLQETVHVKAGMFDTNKFQKEIWENLIPSLKVLNIELEVVPFKAEEGVSVYDRLLDEALQYDFILGGTVKQFYGSSESGGQYYDTICPVWYTYALPVNIYSSKYSALDELPDGTEIYILSDTASHALKVLESTGLITLKGELPVFNAWLSENDAQAYLTDIILENLKHISVQIANATVIRNFGFPPDKEYDAVVLDGQLGQMYKMNYGRTRMLFEDPLTDEDYIPAIYARKDAVNDPERRKVIECVMTVYQSQVTIDYMNKIGLANKPAGWGINILDKYR